jgi:hypothetical protein
MLRFRLSNSVWKSLLTACAVLVAVLLVAEFSHAVQTLLLDGRQGGLGLTLDDRLGPSTNGTGTHYLRIQAVAADSPLLAQGARTGDVVRFERHADRWRRYAAGETIPLLLYRGGDLAHAPLRLAIRTRPEPPPFADAFDFWGRLALAVPALLFAVLIACKQPEARTYRGFAMMFLALSLMLFYTYNYSPAGVLFYVSKIATITTFPLIWYWCVVFILHYQAYTVTPVRRVLMRLFRLYRPLAFAIALYALWFALGGEAPLLWVGSQFAAIGALALCLASLLDGWAQCGGEVKQRHLWLLLSFVAGALPSALTWVPALNGQYRGLPVLVAAVFAGQLLMYVGLVYAVLRHRIFHFDFAISRALVFSAVSLLLLCAFGMIKWMSSSFIHVDQGGHRNLALDAAVALFAYLGFHHLHSRIERWIERLFFHAWHENERKLRHYVRQAAHVTDAGALYASLITALDRFTGQRGVALYARQADGRFTLVQGTLAQAPAAIGANEPVAVALRSDLQPLAFRGVQASLPGDLALPMSHRGNLNGFAIVGAKSHGQTYRPDEIEVLGFAVAQVGLDLYALRVEELERNVNQLTEFARRQQAELAVVGGRRRAVRQDAAQQQAGGRT